MGQDSIKENETVVQLCDGQKSVSTRSMSRTVIAAMANKIIDMILHAPLEPDLKENYCTKLSGLASDEGLIMIFLSCDCKITPMDMKYILCFYIDMMVRDISLTFNVEVASIYTVRYRIRKKFKDNLAFQFLM